MNRDMPIVDDYLLMVRLNDREHAQLIWDCMNEEGRAEAKRRIAEQKAADDQADWEDRVNSARHHY